MSKNFFERHKELGNKDNKTEQWDGVLVSELPTSYTSFVIPFSNALAETFVACILITFMLSINWQSTSLALFTVAIVFAAANILTRSPYIEIRKTRSKEEVLTGKKFERNLVVQR